MGNCCKSDKPAQPVDPLPTADSHANRVILSTPSIFLAPTLVLRSYQKRITEQPLDGQARAAYGKMLYRMGLDEYALTQLRVAVSMDSADGETYLVLGIGRGPRRK